MCVKVCVCVCEKDLKQVWSDEKDWVKCVFCTLPRGYSSLYKVLVVFQNSGTWIREASFDTHTHTSVIFCHTTPSLKHTHTHTCVHTIGCLRATWTLGPGVCESNCKYQWQLPLHLLLKTISLFPFPFFPTLLLFLKLRLKDGFTMWRWSVFLK